MRGHPTACLLLSCLLIAVALPLAAAPMPGDHFQPFALNELGGQVARWQPGREAVLSFCAFWCDTWKEQSKRLADASKALAGLAVDFMTISVDGRWSELAVGKIAGKALLDPGGTFCRSLGMDSIPYTVVLDKDGRVSYAARGIVRAAAIEKAVRDSISGKPADSGETVYLAFDDFPFDDRDMPPGSVRDLDDRLLDVLRCAGARATFFCIGSRVAQNQEVIRRAAHEGHSLQIHSWAHSPENPMIERCSQVLADLTGIKPTLYHAPGSSEFVRIGRERLQAAVVNPYDYTRPGEKELIRRVLLAVKPGSVILLHAGVSQTIETLPEIIRALRSRGFGFGVLE